MRAPAAVAAAFTSCVLQHPASGPCHGRLAYGDVLDFHTHMTCQRVTTRSNAADLHCVLCYNGTVHVLPERPTARQLSDFACSCDVQCELLNAQCSCPDRSTFDGLQTSSAMSKYTI